MPKLRNAVYLLVVTSSVAIAAYQPGEFAAPDPMAFLTPQAVAPIAKAAAGRTWHEAQSRPGAKLE